MLLTTINGRDGTAEFSINGVLYSSILNEFEAESNTELIDSSVFSIEGVATQDPGMERIFFRFSGLLKKGATSASGPMIPAPQGVPVTITFSSSCTIVMPSTNFSRVSARRTVNRNGAVSGEGVSNGMFSCNWVRV